MAQSLILFIHPDDEAAFLQQFAEYNLTLYPDFVPPDWQAPMVNGEAVSVMGEDSCWYLAAEGLDEVSAYPIKRGPHKGYLKIEEVPSPVFYYERSMINDEGELVGGKLWVELEGIDGLSMGHPKPYGLKVIYNNLTTWINKTYKRSNTKGIFASPKAVSLRKANKLVLRLPGHHGKTVDVWKY